MDAANSYRHNLWAQLDPCRWFRMLCLVVCSGCWRVDCATLHRACWINWKKRRGVGLSDWKKVEECQKKTRFNGSKPLPHHHLQPFTEKSRGARSPPFDFELPWAGKLAIEAWCFSYQSINFTRKIRTTKLTVLVVSYTRMLGYKIVAAVLDKGTVEVKAMVRSSNDSH